MGGCAAVRANPEKKWLFPFQHRIDRCRRTLRRAHRLDHRRRAGGDIPAGVDVGDGRPAVLVDDDVPDVPFVALTNRRKSPFRRFDSFLCGEAAQQSPTAAQSPVPNRQYTRTGVPAGFRILREVIVRGIPGHGFPSVLSP